MLPIQFCNAQNATNPNWLIMIYYDHQNDLCNEYTDVDDMAYNLITEFTNNTAGITTAIKGQVKV